MDASNEYVLRGPFHTRDEAARRAGLAPPDLAAMAGAVRLDGPMSLEEVYPAFQFAADGGFLPGLPEVVERLALDGRAAAGWLVAPQQGLGSRSPVEWLGEGRPLQALLDLAARSGTG